MNLKTIIHISVIAFLLTSSSAFGFQLNFTPRITATEEYTDNLFLDPVDEKDDFITTLSPGFTAEMLGRSEGVSLSYDPGYVFYNRFNEFDGWRHNASLTGWKQIARNTRLELEDAFLYTDDPSPDGEVISEFTEEPIIASDTTIRQNRETYYTNTAGIRLNHQFGASDALDLGYAYSILRNDDPSYVDNDTHTPSIGLTYWFLPEWRIEADAHYTTAQFSSAADVPTADDSDDLSEWYGSARMVKRFTRHFEGFVQYAHTSIDYKGDTEDYQVYDSSIGMNYTMAEELALSLRAGYFIQDLEESEDEDGIVIDGLLDKTWTFRRGSIYLAGSSGYDANYGGAENLGFSLYYQAESRVEYGFTRQFTGDIYASYRRNKYTDPVEEDRIDKITVAGAGLEYQARRWASLRLDYSYRTVDSTDITNEYDENRVLFTVTLSPSQPIRLSQ